MTNILPVAPRPARVAVTLTSDFESPILNLHIPIKEAWYEPIPGFLEEEAKAVFTVPVLFDVEAFVGLKNDEFDASLTLNYPKSDLPDVIHKLLSKIPDTIQVFQVPLGPVGAALAFFGVPDEGIFETIGARLEFLPAEAAELPISTATEIGIGA